MGLTRLDMCSGDLTSYSGPTKVLRRRKAFCVESNSFIDSFVMSIKVSKILERDLEIAFSDGKTHGWGAT